MSSPAQPEFGGRKISTSRRWLQPRVSKEQLYRLAPRKERPARLGEHTAWDRIRFALRSWVLWLVAAFTLSLAGQRLAAIFAAAVAAVLNLARPRFHPAVYPIESKLAPGSPEFGVTMGGVTGTAYLPGNQVRIFNNGDEFYPAMLDAIEAAAYSVTMEQYIFWDGSVGLRFAEALATRARAGIPVKLLVDAVGSATIGENLLRILEAAGCQLAWFHPIRWFTLARANNRTHRKSIIVDGQVAFTGGAGLADQWLGAGGAPMEWRDLMVRTEGPAALAQQAGFAQNWMQTTGEILAGRAFFPNPEPCGDVAVQTILSSPAGGSGTAGTMYLLALQSAQRYVWIANPYFIPSSAVIDLLSRAVRRGVQIRLMVAGAHSDTWWARQNSVRLYGKLLRAGVEIYEYLPSMLHHKTMVVDGSWATVGTTNFDNRSFAFNEETNLCFSDARIIADLERIFADDLRRSRRVQLDEWRRRSLWRRLSEEAASLIEDQV